MHHDDQTNNNNNLLHLLLSVSLFQFLFQFLIFIIIHLSCIPNVVKETVGSMDKYLESSNINHLQESDNDNYGYLQKYKGVVLQQNGNWGAQIYTNNQRIWLGTFKSEVDAATAYDRASMKLRSPDAPRNFPLTKSTLLEANFQSQYNRQTILAMIKDGSYQEKFEEFQRQKEGKESLGFLPFVKGKLGFCSRVLFHKELTPSDVSKLNRLVIPKRYAVRYFPRIPDDVAGGLGDDDVELSFYDTQRRLWKFRYCYWKSSQSFVFTRGWSQFVKDKKLKSKDKLTFYYQENLNMPSMSYWMIDVSVSTSVGRADLKRGAEGEGSLKDDRMDGEIVQTSKVKSHGLKLFGVQIVE